MARHSRIEPQSVVEDAIQDALDHALESGDDVTAFELALLLRNVGYGEAVAGTSDLASVQTPPTFH